MRTKSPLGVAGTAVLVAAMAFGLPGCGGEPGGPAVTLLQGATMGTTYTVKVVDLPVGLEAEALQADVDRILQGINASMSTYQEDSELSRFNRSNDTSWTPASPDLVSVLDEALRVSILTDGAFDVTVGPLVSLWGFGPSPAQDKVPPDAEIGAARARVGYVRLHVSQEPPAVKKDRPDLYVDLSAIAKGFAVDAVAEHLEARGVHDYMVEIGGEVRARGQNERDVPWRIAVERPQAGERAVHQVIQLEDGAVATSGDYRNYFERDGKRYSHTIDPTTGYPIAHNLASVTVVHASTSYADAMATALMVLGPDAGYQLARNEELAALFISKSVDGFVDRATPAFSQYEVD